MGSIVQNRNGKEWAKERFALAVWPSQEHLRDDPGGIERVGGGDRLAEGQAGGRLAECHGERHGAAAPSGQAGFASGRAQLSDRCLRRSLCQLRRAETG